jgi:hypothetical protein
VSRAPGNNTFRVRSVRDGNYTFVITRLSSDIQHTPGGDGIVLAPVSTAGPAPAIALSPSVVNGSTYSYTAAVPFVTVGVTVTVRFSTPDSITTDVDYGGYALAVTQEASQAYPLTINTTHTLHVNSSIDGYYSFAITRLPPDVTAIALTGLSSTNQETNLVPLLNTPFVPGVTAGYNLTVPAIVVRLTGRLAFGVADSITAYVQSQAVQPQSDVPWPSAFELVVGINTLVINSTRDGVYTLTITRLPPDVQNLYPVGLGESGLVTAYSLSSPVAWVSQLGLVVKALRGFTPGQFSYTLDVAYIVRNLTFTPTFITPGSLQMGVGPMGTLADQVTLAAVDSAAQTAPIMLPVAPAALVFWFVSAKDGQQRI